jgi:hypothetical protein
MGWRCQIPAWAESWMTERHGELISVVKGVASVKLDGSGRTVRFMFCDLAGLAPDPCQTRAA